MPGELNPSKRPEVRAKISAAMKGRKMSDEQKKKLSAIVKEQWKNKEFREAVTKAQIGRKQSKETIEKRVAQFRSEKSPHWKGDEASYVAIHMWLRKCFGKADHCDMCGGGKNYHWSCRNGKPDRNLQNWWMLCVKCHKNYDLIFVLGGKHQTGKYKRQ